MIKESDRDCLKNEYDIYFKEILFKKREYSNTLRPVSLYTILSFRRSAMAPHDADVVTTSCGVRPSTIPSVTILYIGGNRRPS